ncbi:MAG: transporter [Kiritimatiellae bacterium]|jgi:hypothetical protein|nr:transporter [Kiritimatiellia bacterium]
MPHSKRLLLLALSTLFVVASYADPQRTLLTFENRFPRWEQLEVGGEYQQVNYDGMFGADVSSAAAYVRYGILDNLAVRMDVPFVEVDPETGSSESGPGDMEVEFQLRTYEDIFGYPYFIPHVSFTLPTGDEDKGLGADGTIVTAGMSWGTQMWDHLGWVLDVSYRIHPDEENRLLVGNSYIWDISNKFALLTEIGYEQETDEEDDLILISGGMAYDWSKSLQMAVHAGTGLSGDLDSFFDARLSYSF